MAKNDSASITILHQPRAKTAAERGRAFRERQRNASAIRSGNPAPAQAQPLEKSKTFANGEQSERDVRERPTTPVRFERTKLPQGPAFAELERTTAELIASCQRGIKAARLLFGPQIKPRE